MTGGYIIGTREFRFVVGSQFLYGPEVLETVEARAKEMAGEMSKKLPYPLVFKTIGVTCEGITNVIKEANYHDKSGVFPRFGAFLAKSKQNTGKLGPRSGHHDCAEVLFSLPAPGNRQKCWCTFLRSLLCKVLRALTRRRDLNLCLIKYTIFSKK